MFSINKAYVARVLLPVFLGAVIYCLLRDPSLIIFRLINSSTLYNFILFLQQISMPVAELFPRWLLYSLPDALWSYACTSLILIYWREGPLFFKAFWLSVAITLSLGFEVGQLLNLVPGTFCAYDLLSSTAAVALALSHEVFRKVSVKTGLGNTLTTDSSGAPV